MTGFLRLKLALQAQTKTAIIPTTSKKASSAQGYATSVALATGWRGGTVTKRRRCVDANLTGSLIYPKGKFTLP